MFNDSLTWIETINWNKLFAFIKIRLEPVIYATPYAIMVKFAYEDTVVYSIECFLEVYKDSDCSVIFIKCLSYFIGDVDKSMISRMFFPKTVLMFIDALVFFEKTINPVKDKFFENFVNVRQ